MWDFGRDRHFREPELRFCRRGANGRGNDSGHLLQSLKGRRLLHPRHSNHCLRICILGVQNLTSITIPCSVKEIGKDAFHLCSGLVSAVVAGPVSSIEDSAFNRCVNLSSVTIPDTVSFIGEFAFYDCFTGFNCNSKLSLLNWEVCI